MKKTYNTRKRYIPPITDLIILNDMDNLLRRSVRVVIEEEGEFEEEIEGSTEPARAKGLADFSQNDYLW